MTKKIERRRGGQVTSNPHIGCSRENYDRIADIANECDMKLSDVVNELLGVAFEHIEIVEINIPIKKMRRKG
ncbi:MULTISPECIES: hypothetical protein [unclassified Streptococcus]|uniref:hypothetical protein n=1 Tax=unclassified Streptococcus TaxID=2608887 RepID=UPI00211B4249|nr:MULTISPECIES: hypothetical protein [unclassified Streptococcus]MCQ9212267.1 hypothetical protein [Streptococcus sp. B01]MCQ9213598.1 hypothetical protein [Streptococcus sp. O1]